MEATRLAPAARRVVALLLFAALLAAVAFWQLNRPAATLNANAASSIQMFAFVHGQKQGDFKGDSPRKGHEKESVVSFFGYGIVSPRDAASGLATGKRQHKPIVITKVVGASSPQFLSAIASNENLTTVVVNFWRTDRTGASVNYYRVTLTNGSVSEVRQYTQSGEELEDISMTFQKIEHTDLIAKTTFMDDWSAATT